MAASAASAALSLPPLGALACWGLAVAAVVTAVGLSKLIGLFYVFPFSHADND